MVSAERPIGAHLPLGRGMATPEPPVAVAPATTGLTPAVPAVLAA